MSFKEIGKLIKERRVEAKMSQSELSDKLGYRNGQFISNVERQLCSIPSKKLKLASDLLDIDIELLKKAMVIDYTNRLENATK